MNFILMISVCSFFTGNCFMTAESKFTYSTWKECVDDALYKSTIIMQSFPTKEINEYKLATNYSCYEQDKTKT